MAQIRKKRSLVAARKQALYRRVRASLEGEDIAECLSLTGNERADRLAEMIRDPSYAKFSFGQLCSRAGLSAIDVAYMYCEVKKSVGMIRMARYIPDIMEQLALGAMHHLEKCHNCQGSRRVEVSVCSECGGAGEVQVKGDLGACRLLFKIFGLLPGR